MGATLRVYGGLNQPDNLGITEERALFLRQWGRIRIATISTSRIRVLDLADPDEVD